MKCLIHECPQSALPGNATCATHGDISSAALVAVAIEVESRCISCQQRRPLTRAGVCAACADELGV